MKQVFIAEEIRAKNKGEAAICWGIVEGIKSLYPECKIHLCSSEPQYDTIEYGNNVELLYDNYVSTGGIIKKIVRHTFLLSRYFFFIVLFLLIKQNVIFLLRSKLWKVILETDLFIIGHDNTFVNAGPYTLITVPIVARILKKPVIVYAGSVGPFSSKISEMVTRWILSKANLITLRENVSLKRIETYNLKSKNIHLTADPAFIMQAADEKRIQEILLQENVNINKEVICTTISQELASVYERSTGLKCSFKKYVKMRADLLEFMVKEFDVNIMILSHSIGPESFRDDRVASRLVYDTMKEKENTYLIKGDYNAKELKGLIGKCQFLIADRTHSMIAATSLGIPILGFTSIKRHQKNKGIIGDMFNLNECIIDVENLEYSELKSRAIELWKNRKSTKKIINEHLPDVISNATKTAILAKQLLTNGK